MVSVELAMRLMFTLATAVLTPTHAVRRDRYHEKLRNHHTIFLIMRGILNNCLTSEATALLLRWWTDYYTAGQ